MFALRRQLLVPVLAMVATLALRAATTFAQTTQPATTESPEAIAHFQQGRTHYEAQRYASALEEFRASLALMPSPNTRLFIARSLREMGHNADAYEEYARAAVEADGRANTEPRYARTAESARQESAALLPRVAMVSVSVRGNVADAVVTVNGVALDSTRWNQPIPVEPGTVTIDASAPGRAAYHSTAPATAGMLSRVAIDLAPLTETPTPVQPQAPEPTQPTAAQIGSVSPTTQPVQPPPNSMAMSGGAAPRQRSPVRRVGGIAVAAGVLLGVAGLVFGFLTYNEYAALQSDCGSGPCPSSVTDAQQRVNTGKALGIATDVGLAAGGVFIVLGAILLAAGSSSESHAALRHVTLAIDAHGAPSVGVRMEF